MSRIIIAGGGFGGVKCAKALRKHLPEDKHEIIVFNRENHMVFFPLLAELASGALDPRQVAAPLRKLLPGVDCRTGEVVAVDLNDNEIEFQSIDGRSGRLNYDHLVIAHGNTVNLAAIPGMADHSFPLKTVGDAIEIQQHVIGQLEKAYCCNDPDLRRWYCTFVVIGAGFSGVELAGELNDFVRKSLRYYGNIRMEDCSVILVHSGEEILPEVSPSLREFARIKMEHRGVRLLLKTAAASCTAQGVHFKDGTFLAAGTVLCTIGTRPLPMLEHMKLPKDRGRLITQPDMSLPGHPNVWAIGDCAANLNGFDNKYAPPTGQFAEREGSQVAANIVARLEGKKTSPFYHKSLGSLCSIGGHNAVAEMFGVRIHGFIAWFAWRGVYLFKLPSFSQQVKVGLDWALELIFPPDLSHLRSDSTSRFAKARYETGDNIFKKGDPASDFYVIESGEIEIISTHDESGQEEILATLGPGDFFGEAALMDHCMRRHTTRARSNTELLVVGKRVFDELFTVIPSLNQAIRDSVRRRTRFWDKMPDIGGLLDTMLVRELMEPADESITKPDESVLLTIARMNNQRLDSCFVVDEQGMLIGMLTRSDLGRALESAASLPLNKRDKITIKDIMINSPKAATQDDTLKPVLSSMREHGFKQMPVVASETDRTFKGCIRIEHILHIVIQRLLPRPYAMHTD